MHRRKELEQCRQQICSLEASIDEKDEEMKEVSEEKQEELRLKSEQNSALFDQLQTMGAELQALKHGILSVDRDVSSTAGSNLNLRFDFNFDQNELKIKIPKNFSASGDDGREGGSEHLLQVVHFLRKEKDNAVQQVDDLKVKLADYKAQLELTEQHVRRKLFRRILTMRIYLGL